LVAPTIIQLMEVVLLLLPLVVVVPPPPFAPTTNDECSEKLFKAFVILA